MHYVYNMHVYTQICSVKKGDFPDIKMYNWLDVRVAVCGALPVTCLELINHSLTPPLCLVPWTPWSDISSRKFSLNTTFPAQAWHMPSRLSG